MRIQHIFGRRGAQAARSRTILHVGGHKTGTSSMQAAFREGRDALRDAGIAFPELTKSDGGAQSHSEAALALTSGKPKHVAAATTRLAAARAAHEVPVTLFSSEELNRFVAAEDGVAGYPGQQALLNDYLGGTERYWARRAVYLERLRAAFGDPPPEIWITLRRQDSFAMSMYQQSVKNRRYVGLVREFAASNFALFDYERILDQWAAAFGTVRVFVYEDAANEEAGLIGTYLRALGAPDLARTIPQKRINTSAHPHVVEFLRRSNYYPVDRKELRVAISRWMRAHRAALGTERYVLLSTEERRAMLERFAAANARIRTRYGIETPGRTTLFPTITDDPRPVYPGLDDALFDVIARGAALAGPLYP